MSVRSRVSSLLVAVLALSLGHADARAQMTERLEEIRAKGGPAAVPLQNSALAPHLFVPSEEIPTSVAGEGATELVIDDFVQLASANHPSLRSAAEDVEAAQGNALQVGLYPNPQLGTASPQIVGQFSQYNLFGSQQFVTAHKLQLNRSAAKREVSKAQLAYQQAWFEVVTGVRRQFYRTLVAQQRVVVLRHLSAIARDSRDASQKLLDAGEGSKADVLMLDIQFQQADIKLANAEVYLEANKEQLAIATGVPGYQFGRLVGDLTVPIPSYELSQLPAEVAANNTQARQARVEIDRRQVMLQRASVEPRPNLNVIGGYQYQVGIPAQNQGLFQLTFDVPLWNRNQGNIRAAQANIQGAMADSRAIELTLADSAVSALADYRAAGQTVERYEKHILVKARESLEIIQGLHAKGEVDFLRLLQAQQALVEADLAYIEAQQSRWDAAVTIAGLLQVEQFP